MKQVINLRLPLNIKGGRQEQAKRQIPFQGGKIKETKQKQLLGTKILPWDDDGDLALRNSPSRYPKEQRSECLKFATRSKPFESIKTTRA